MIKKELGHSKNGVYTGLISIKSSSSDVIETSIKFNLSSINNEIAKKCQRKQSPPLS